MNETIADLLKQRKSLDAKLKRAVAKAFPVGSRWELRDRWRRTRKGIVVVESCRRDTVSVKWENATDNYDAKNPIWGPSSVGKSFTESPCDLHPLPPTSSPAKPKRADGRAVGEWPCSVRRTSGERGPSDHRGGPLRCGRRR